MASFEDEEYVTPYFSRKLIRKVNNNQHNSSHDTNANKNIPQDPYVEMKSFIDYHYVDRIVPKSLLKTTYHEIMDPLKMLQH